MYARVTRWLLYKRTLSAVFVFAALTLPAHAAPDFYGVQMKSEDFAQDTFLIENNKIADFSNNRPGTDKRIYAYGYTSSVVGGGHGFSIEVFNHSDKAIGTEKLFRELVLVAYDGRRYDRSETEMMWSRDRLGPGEEATFNFKFPGILIGIDEIRMVICSFDLGNTSIYLFPLRAPEAPVIAPKKKEPKKIALKKETPKKEAQKNLSKTETPKNSAEKKQAAPFCPAPIKALQAFFHGVGERMSGKNEPEPPPVSPEDKKVVEVNAEGATAIERAGSADKQTVSDYPLVRPEQVIEGARYQFSPSFRKQVQESQRQVEKTVYRDRSWSLDNPDRLFTHESAGGSPVAFPRREANVVLVNPEYGFVVVDAGFENGFGKNVILDVVRNGRRIGKVMITKPRDKMSGAVILPEWRTREEIRSGDIVGLSR